MKHINWCATFDSTSHPFCFTITKCSRSLVLFYTLSILWTRPFESASTALWLDKKVKLFCPPREDFMVYPSYGKTFQAPIFFYN